MMNCPYCGTLNRKGSKYCSKCGQRLDTLSDICPACNKANPRGSAFCGFCGAPMRPPDGQRAASASAARPAEPVEEELPPWLYETSTTAEPPRGQVTVGSPAPTPGEPVGHLEDIEDALPGTEGWLLSAQKGALAKPSPAQPEAAGTADTRSGRHKGCLPVVLAAVLSLVVLALSWVVWPMQDWLARMENQGK